MTDHASIQQDIKTIRDIEGALEEAESFIGRVKDNKVRLTLQNGQISITRDEMAKITDLVITLERSGKALDSAVKYLRELMAFDEVSQMFSRRYILHLTEKEMLRAKRYENAFSLLVMEMEVLPADDMALPHLTSDDINLVVGEAARAVRRRIRDADSAGRMGERAFLLLLPETEAGGAVTLAERLMKDVEQTLDVSGGKVRMASYCALLDGLDPALESMAHVLFQIDQKLAEAREDGVNTLVK